MASIVAIVWIGKWSLQFEYELAAAPVRRSLIRQRWLLMFVVFEGMDGVGKSTQIQLLAQWLQDSGAAVTTCRDPGSTALGDAVRQMLLQKTAMSIDAAAETLLFLTARAQLVREVIRPALQRGDWVLCDRFQMSTLAYQVHAGKMHRDDVAAAGIWATDRLAPDHTFVLDMEPETAVGRIRRSHDRMESRGLEFMRKVRAGFLREAEMLADRATVVDASESVETIAGTIREVVAQWPTTAKLESSTGKS